MVFLGTPFISLARYLHRNAFHLEILTSAMRGYKLRGVRFLIRWTWAKFWTYRRFIFCFQEKNACRTALCIITYFCIGLSVVYRYFWHYYSSESLNKRPTNLWRIILCSHCFSAKTVFITPDVSWALRHLLKSSDSQIFQSFLRYRLFNMINSLLYIG